MTINELNTALGKRCNVSLDVVGFSPKNLTGILTKIEHNTVSDHPAITLQIEEISITIPLEHVLSFKIEE